MRKQLQQTLIVMALAGATAAIKIEQVNQVNSTDAQNKASPESEIASALQRQISSGETELNMNGEPTLVNTNNITLNGENSFSSNQSDTEVMLLNSLNEFQEATDDQPTLSSYGYSRSYNYDTKDLEQNQLKSLKNQFDQMQQRFTGLGPKLTAISDQNTNNRADIMNQLDSADQQRKLHSDLGNNVESNMQRIKDLQNQLQSENKTILSLQQNLIALTAQSEQTGGRSLADMNMLRNLNKKIMIQIKQEHQNVTNIQNQLEIVNRDYISMNTNFDSTKKSDTKALDKLRKDCREMAQACKHNYESANSNLSKLDNFAQEIGNIDKGVGQLRSELQGDLQDEFKQLKQSQNSMQDQLKSLQSNYGDFRVQTDNLLKSNQAFQSKTYGQIDNQFQDLQNDIKLQEASSLSLKSRLDEQINQSNIKSQVNHGNRDQDLELKFANQDELLNRYQMSNNEKNEKVKTKLDMLRANIEALGNLYHDNNHNQEQDLLSLKQDTETWDRSGNGQILKLQQSIKQAQEQSNDQLVQRFEGLSNMQQDYDQASQENQKLMNQYQEALQNQEKEIISLQRKQKSSKNNMQSKWEDKLKKFQGSIDELQGAIGEQEQAYETQIKGLESECENMQTDSQNKDDILKRWVTGCHEQMQTLQTDTDEKIEVLKQILSSEEEESQNERSKTNRNIQGYLSSMKKEYNNGDKEHTIRLQSAMDDTTGNELVLKAQLTTVAADMDDIISAICMDHQLQKEHFQRYLQECKSKKAIQQDQLLQSTSVDSQINSYDTNIAETEKEKKLRLKQQNKLQKELQKQQEETLKLQAKAADQDDDDSE